MNRILMIIALCSVLTDCTRHYIRPMDPTPPEEICRQELLVDPGTIPDGRRMRTEEGKAIISEYRQCGQHFEKVARRNAEIAAGNRPDSFLEDLFEFSLGFALPALVLAMTL